MEPIRGLTEINDPFYRYKMEKIKFSREKTKTCISNLEEIAKYLGIPNVEIILSFLKKRLSISIVNNKNRLIITNKVNTKNIQDALYEFIEIFVLCQNEKCKKPELIYNIHKDKLQCQCKACGHLAYIIDTNLTSPTIKTFMNILVH